MSAVDAEMASIPILLVEDDSIEVDMIRERLDKANIQNPIYRVCDGYEALEVLHGHDNRMKLPQPCLILLDINMPRMNGFQFLDKMQQDKNLKQNVVFMLTTSNRNEDKINAYERGVAGYVLKDDLNGLGDMLRIYCSINKFPQAAE